MRSAEITRETTETKIRLGLGLEGAGRYDCDTGIGFLDHMLEQFTRHGRFDLTVKCAGDTHVDGHHTAEDIGIALGQAFTGALGDKRGIARYASCNLPMDEALVLVALDISGRAHLRYDVRIPAARVGEFDSELLEEFLTGFTRSMGFSLHVQMLSGANSHHIIEAVFKGLGRALSEAVSIDPRQAGEIPSTKGAL